MLVNITLSSVAGQRSIMIDDSCTIRDAFREANLNVGQAVIYKNGSPINHKKGMDATLSDIGIAPSGDVLQPIVKAQNAA